MAAELKIEQLWRDAGFRPNDEQREAILHTDGPLYLPAGPGSGKTRVLLWRALNLIVFHGVQPGDIFLSTFTEKAARQLREGIRTYLGYATARTQKPYDISHMYVGTVHSLCQRITQDRRFSPDRARPRAPVLMDELSQYFFIYRNRNWEQIRAGVDNAVSSVNACFGSGSTSRHRAVGNCTGLFNRLSEECITPEEARARTRNADLRSAIALYANYLNALAANQPPLTDFALLQQHGLRILREGAGRVAPFRHVIIDEYQDTNTIQERLFFELAKAHKNICVVGDDDQALYRFRGSTVENFVEFPARCREHLSAKPRKIVLAANYRSREPIISFCRSFIEHPTCNWQKRGRPGEYYRVMDKDLRPVRTEPGAAVVASSQGKPADVYAEIAELVRAIIDKKKVSDPNQIAFLWPSLGSSHVQPMIAALEKRKLDVYAPRANGFLDTDEAQEIFGLYLQLFGVPGGSDRYGGAFDDYMDWVRGAKRRGRELMDDDSDLRRYIEDHRTEIDGVVADYRALAKAVNKAGLDWDAPYEPATMRAALMSAQGLSNPAKASLADGRFERYVAERAAAGQPYRLSYVVNRSSALDWSVLDLFYQLCGFKHFRRMFDVAARTPNPDEGPICNLGLLSQYIARFMDDYAGSSVLTGRFLNEDGFVHTFFSSYVYALHRQGISEYEDAEDPFPKGRIPFITIHQAKGLEFPVVVLGTPRKGERLQEVEELVQPLIRREGEPVAKMPVFDVRRMFYVAISRPKNLLVIAHYRGQGQHTNEPFASLLDDDFPRIPDLDVDTLPVVDDKSEEMPETYSYTADYLVYKKCPRQYMIYRKYGFVPSRSQTMFFGSLVHSTLEDLHHYLIAERGKK